MKLNLLVLGFLLATIFYLNVEKIVFRTRDKFHKNKKVRTKELTHHLK